jgi:O-antigen ligase
LKQLALLFPFAGFVFILPFPGTVAFRLVCLSAAFLIAILMWRKLAPPPIPAKAALLLWAALALVSVAYSFDPAYSLSEVKNEVGYTLMAFIAFFAFTQGERELRATLVALVAATAVISVWGVADTAYSGLWTEAAGHGGSGGTATLLCVAGPAVAIAILGAGQRRCRVALAVVLIAAALAALATRQRIIWPIWLFDLVLGLALLKGARLISFSRRALAAIVVAAAAAAVLAATGMQAWREHTGAMKAVDVRGASWPAVVERVNEQPWTGAGFGRQAMRKAYPDLVSGEDVLFWHAHNAFLNAAVSMGWPGAAALLILFAAFAAAYAGLLGSRDRLARLIGVAGLLLIASVVGRNLTNDFFVRDGALLFWALNGALLGVGLRRGGSVGAES